MSPNQFQLLMERLDRFEERFATRLSRVEIQVAALCGGLTLGGVLVAAGVINI